MSSKWYKTTFPIYQQTQTIEYDYTQSSKHLYTISNCRTSCSVIHRLKDWTGKKDIMSFETIQTEITALRNDIKNLAKLVRKVKNTQEDPDGEKAKARAANNGFNRKQDVTPKLREFLGLPAEELISRSEVTKFITKYIAEQGLKHPENGRQIVLDGKLRELLAPPAEVVVTYLNLQKYLSPHYIKKEA
jgi:chromatin remodeling complex protein RSC6|tara:strand:+ start:6691 stop:7257 length:567 start_codon:yes stop_codon:yes gene_type:complete